MRLQDIDSNGHHRHVTVERLDTGEKFEEDVDFVVAARGALNNIKWPIIPGFETFKGEKMHSAQWNPRLVLTSAQTITEQDI